MFDVQRKTAKQRRDLHAKERRAHAQSIQDNETILELASVAQRIALEAALMAATQGIARGLTSALLEGGALASSGTSTAGRVLATVGRAPAAMEGAEAIRAAAVNTLARCVSAAVVGTAKQTANAALGGSFSGAGLAWGLVLAFFGRPGPAGSWFSVQGLASATGLTRAALSEFAGKMSRAPEAQKTIVRQQVRANAADAVAAAVDALKKNDRRSMLAYEQAARRLDYSKQLPFLVRHIDLFDAHGVLKSDHAGYARHEAGYILWRNMYDFLVDAPEQLKQAEQMLLVQSRIDRILLRARRKWDAQQAAARRENEAAARRNVAAYRAQHPH